jgi:methyltransferase, FkbM family
MAFLFSGMAFDTTSPWGAHAPRGLAAVSLRLIDLLPVNGFGKRLAFILRKPVKRSARPVFDREVWGLRLRLSTRGNLSEQRWLTMPAFHDAVERTALAEALPPGGVFFDVGMNAGFYTFWALSLRRPGLRVISIEPGPAMLERVRHNLAQNRLAEAVTLNACAVTPVPCEVVLETHATNLGQNCVRAANGSSANGELRVPGRPLLDIARDAGVERIDALKIDIEGHETPVLKAFFRDAPRSLWPKLIVAEIVGDGEGTLRRLLLDHGYKIERETKMNGILRLAE